MISNRQLAILACPSCKGGLVHDDGGSRLICLPCGLGYPIREGIPVMLLDEAEKVDIPRSEACNLDRP